MDEKKYAYQNRALKNIKGEKWQNIPNLAGYFMISNYGRVKRLEYELEFADGRIYLMNSMIMKPTLVKYPNHFINDTIHYLKITLTVAGNIYNFSIARMVYHCFIKPLNWSDENLLVVCRDRDGRNIRISNLLLLSRHERQMKIISGQRRENILLRKEVRKKAAIANQIKNGKVISQYDREGNRLMTYANIPAGARAVGISISAISGVVRGRKVTAAGYFWRNGTEKKIDIDNFLRKRKEMNKSFIGKKIIQYTTNGREIATYISINEASRKSGACSTTIGKVINGKARTAGGFLWKKGKK